MTKSNSKRNAAKAAKAVTAIGTSSNKSRARPKPTKTSASPWDLYIAKQEAFLDAHTEILGPMIVKGLDSPGEEYDSDDSDDALSKDRRDRESSKITASQLETFRYVMITQNRDDQLESMRRLVLGEKADDDCLMFNTSFSYHVLKCWEHIKRRKLTSRKTQAQKLDILFAFTHTLQEFDVWMHDNEGGMDVLVKGLAAAWKKLLQKSNSMDADVDADADADAELGWDVEYTKPGMLELLGRFQRSVQKINDDGDGMYDLGRFKFL